jgi:hypothetical protein
MFSLSREKKLDYFFAFFETTFFLGSGDFLAGALDFDYVGFLAGSLDFESVGFFAGDLDFESVGFFAGDLDEFLLRLRSVVVFLTGTSFLEVFFSRALFFSTSLCIFSLWFFIFSSSFNLSLTWLSCNFLIFSDWISFEFCSISNLLSSKTLVRSFNLLPS